MKFVWLLLLVGCGSLVPPEKAVVSREIVEHIALVKADQTAMFDALVGNMRVQHDAHLSDRLDAALSAPSLTPQFIKELIAERDSLQAKFASDVAQLRTKWLDTDNFKNLEILGEVSATYDRSVDEFARKLDNIYGRLK